MVNLRFWTKIPTSSRQASPSSASCKRNWLSFLGNRHGIAAVEFALILPLMLILMIGSAETTEGLNYKRKLNQVAIAVADLVAQAESITKNEIADVMYASGLIMSPFSTANVKVIVANIEFNAKGEAKVVWSINESGGTPWTKGGTPPITIPSGLNNPGTTIIVGKTNGTYIPTFAELAQNMMPRATSISMEGIYFLRPRFTESVTLN